MSSSPTPDAGSESGEPTSTVAPTAAPAAAPRRASIPHQPALDGLRGLALAAILVYHAGFAWAPGAFLSVSTFFTLSGFLITALLVTEHRATGRIDLRDFWRRRLRRLVPALAVTLLAVVVASALLADATQLARLRGDVVASVTYLVNWHFIAGGDQYGALFETASPLQHFWSLAIEEQFYVLFPLLAAALLVWRGGSTRRLVIGLGAVVAASIGIGVYLTATGAPVDRAYFGTDVRAAELVIGALAAVWWVHRRHQGRPLPARPLAAVGTVVLVAVLVLWVTAERTDAFWYQGGLALYAVGTVAIILAATQPGPVQRVLSTRVLVGVGLISYGVYLLHWPVFVWIGPDTGLGEWPLFGVRLAVTFVLAYGMWRLVEQPVRRGERLRGRTAALVAAPAALVLVIGGAWLVGDDQAPGTIDFQVALEAFDQQRPDAAPSPPPTPIGPADPFGPPPSDLPATSTDVPMLSVFGDSTALMTGLGLTDWASANPDRLQPFVGGWAGLGCGVIDEAVRIVAGSPADPPEDCLGWLDRWREKLDAEAPDIALVMLGSWEAADTRLPGDSTFRGLGDPVLDDQVRARLFDGVDLLRERGVVVLLVTAAPAGDGYVGEAAVSGDVERIDRWNELIAEVAAAREGVGIVDLAAWLDSIGDADLRLRPDGIHFTWETAAEVAEWLGPEILRQAAVVDPDLVTAG